MARYPEGHKQAARDEIVRRAAERIRRDGIAATGLRSVMADAGLTHGTFYTHFGSLAELLTEAVDEAVGSTAELITKAVDKAKPDDKFEALVKSYLRPAHRTHMQLGCAASALAPEIARAEEPLRKRFAERNAVIVGLIESVLPAGGAPDDRSMRAYAIFAGMMGTLQLMRTALSDLEAERLMTAGRAAALTLGNQPW